jgi:hypothetical protein
MPLAERELSRSSIPDTVKGYFCPVLWLAQPLYKGFRRFSKGKKGRGMKMTMHIHAVSRLEMVEPYLHDFMV